MVSERRLPPDGQGLLRALADGRLDDVAAGLDQVRASDPPLAEIIAADVEARRGAIGLSELHELQQRAELEAPERPLLRWWVLAILGERGFLDTDLGVIPLAAQVLHELPEEPFAATPVLYVRGRLRRIAAALYVAAPSAASLVEHRALRDAAVADFLRCGFTAEAAITRGLAAALHAITTWEDVLEDLEVVRDARSLLGDLEGSMWVPLIDHLQALVALTAGDLDAADTAIAAVEQRRDVHPVFAAYAEVDRAEHRLVTEEASAQSTKALIAALDGLRHTHPHLLPLRQLHAANMLADFGRIEAARSVGLAGIEWPPTNAVMALTGDLLRIRLDVLDHVPRAADDVLPLLVRMEQLGYVRRAGAVALRMSRDFDRVGATREGETLRAWGLERMPDPRRRTIWEQRWAEPLLAAPPAASRSGATVRVRVLVPVLEVEVEGTPVRLRDTPAKLLLALLTAHPEPLHVERAVDLVWPEASPDVGRPRLNTVVHRLRTALGIDRETLRRIGDVLLLAPDEWEVDLFRFRAALRERDARGSEALDRWQRSITGNLCHVQFPYDDHFIEARRALVAEAERAGVVLWRP